MGDNDQKQLAEAILKTEQEIRANDGAIQTAENFRQYAMHSVEGYSVVRIANGPADEQWGKAADAAHAVVRELTCHGATLRVQLAGLRRRQAEQIRHEAEARLRSVENGTLESGRVVRNLAGSDVFVCRTGTVARLR